MRDAIIPQDRLLAHPNVTAMASDKSDEDATGRSNVPTVALELATKSPAKSEFTIPMSLGSLERCSYCQLPCDPKKSRRFFFKKRYVEVRKLPIEACSIEQAWLEVALP